MGRKFRLCTKKRSRTPRPCQSSSSDVSLLSESAEVSSDPLTTTPDLSDTSHGHEDITVSPESEATALTTMRSNLQLPSSWSDQSSPNNILLCKISRQSNDTFPLKISHCLIVNSDGSWLLSVHNHQVDTTNCAALNSVPSILSDESLNLLLQKIDGLHVCVGQPDVHFVKMVSAKKGKILSQDGKVVAVVDECMATVDGKMCTQTVRRSDCQLLSSTLKCESCKGYRASLRAMHSKWIKRLVNDPHSSDSSSHTNDRYLNTPQKKAKISDLRKRVHTVTERAKRLKDKINQLTENDGHVVDSELHSDLVDIMQKNDELVKKTYQAGSFARLFWDEQLKASSVKDSRQVRWHPMLIKWCLNLKLLSGSAYHALRTSGFVKLPSERTLRDYLHYFSNNPGFQKEVHEQLFEEAKLSTLPPQRRYVSLILDEMKIKEGLVYDKYNGHIIGFTHLGDINDELMKLENDSDHPPIAKQVLVLMVRGLLFKLEFPYAHFSTNGITADLLFPIVWEAIRMLESGGLRVLCVTADGASPNRKFFRMHKSDYLHKTQNIYSEDNRWIYFIADPPHLIKTVRNCWSSSGENGTRHMKVATYIQHLLDTCSTSSTVKVYQCGPMKINGQYIEWNQLWSLYHKVSESSTRSKGLSIAPKLKLEHVKMTSFSRMRVDLAAQVLSKTVADAFAYFDDERTKETQKFVMLFDKLFDCLNVRDLNSWKTKKKPDLKPYTSVDDERFKWMEDEFLAYLRNWELEVQHCTDATPKEKSKLLLSKETLEGLRITVKSFIEMAKHMLSQSGSEKIFFLSERISQDPLENYFGQQRARGGRNENPTMEQCLYNAAAIRVQKSIATDPVRGNCRRKRLLYGDEQPPIDDTPLPKRKRPKK